MGLFDDLLNIAGKMLFDSILDSGVVDVDAKEKEYERKVDAYEKKVDNYEKNALNVDKEKVKKARSKIERARNITDGGHRSTDEEYENDISESNMSPYDFECKKNIPLREAISCADNHQGVYVLYLNGRVMKCGRAAYAQGVRWRFVQYYNLKYDKRAQQGDHWAVTENNRDDIVVSWQCCPVSKCKELEYKLFKKYGKGPWAFRAPAKCDSDSWKLLL